MWSCEDDLTRAARLRNRMDVARHAPHRVFQFCRRSDVEIADLGGRADNGAVRVSVAHHRPDGKQVPAEQAEFSWLLYKA